ncbi:MAG: type IV pilus biogenesis/stability protein PilW [Pseudomonadota bacterium]|nr:type IV pilus biogenesis/stability protein PilW [Pseudomonadota bacterium]
MRAFFTLVLLSLLTAGCVSTAPKTEKWASTERADVHIKLGLDYLRRGQLQVAGDEFNLALQADYRSDGAYHGLAMMKIQQGVADEAVPLLQKAVRLNPDNFVARNDFGTFLCGRGQVDDGMRQLKAVVDNPLNTALMGTYLGMGICYQKLELLDQAQEYYRRALAIMPSLPQALLPMANIEFRQGDHLPARAFIERYFGAGYTSAEALLLGARIEHTLGDQAQTKAYAKQLWRQFPKSAEAEQARRIQFLLR